MRLFGEKIDTEKQPAPKKQITTNINNAEEADFQVSIKKRIMMKQEICDELGSNTGQDMLH